MPHHDDLLLSHSRHVVADRGGWLGGQRRAEHKRRQTDRDDAAGSWSMTLHDSCSSCRGAERRQLDGGRVRRRRGAMGARARAGLRTASCGWRSNRRPAQGACSGRRPGSDADRTTPVAGPLSLRRGRRLGAGARRPAARAARIPVLWVRGTCATVMPKTRCSPARMVLRGRLPRSRMPCRCGRPARRVPDPPGPAGGAGETRMNGFPRPRPAMLDRLTLVLGALLSAPAAVRGQGPEVDGSRWTHLGGDAWHTRYTPAAETTATGTAGAQTAGAGGPPRTPGGRPDLQGVWHFNTTTPLQRPDRLADRTHYTEEEHAALAARTAEFRPWDQRPRRQRRLLQPVLVGPWRAGGRPPDVADRRPERRSPAPADTGRHPPSRLGRNSRARYAPGPVPHRRPQRRRTGRSWPRRAVLVGYNVGPPLSPGGYNNNLQVFQRRTTS